MTPFPGRDILLKLRKVDLVGFKSFCERTHITFSGAGLTCIVGPNGCGKSNIVDAISWVLGEQSHKSLRAERMSDCIFNGTAKRPPLGLAEVSLTLLDPDLAEAAAKVLEAREAEEEEQARETENPSGADASTESVESTDEAADGKPFRRNRAAEKPATHTKPGEVVIGRRLYRSGQSEYLINGRVARLRDIQEIFMGMGLGPDSYAIIEQGRIGQILSSKPMDRRAIIEEAAGVTKYKTKRRLAEAKLESSKVNLSRVNDILVEVEKQLGSLKRQASKARRYAELREEMRGLLRTMMGSKAKELDTEAERLTNLLREIAETEQVQAVSRLEAEQEKLSTRTYELDAELRQNQNLLGQTALELDRAENRIGFNRQRSEELEQRNQQLTGELTQIAAQVNEVEARAAEHEKTVVELRAETKRLEALLAELAARAQQFAATSQATDTRIAELRQATSQLGDELTHLHAEFAQAEQAYTHHSQALSRQEDVERQLIETSVHFREQSEAAEMHWGAAVERAQSLERAVGVAQSQLGELRREQQETSRCVDAARDALAGSRARRASLEQILSDRSYTADAVQKLFASNGEGTSCGFRAVGVLADYAEVEEKYEAAVEQFLRDELEYVVVETFDHARAGIALLREEVGGRATFFVDSLRNLKLLPDEPVIPFQLSEDVVSRLDTLVEFRDPLGPAAKHFLPRLRSAFLVETATAAERLARENAQSHFVTPDGTCYQGRMVSGGRPTEAGPLVMKRELRALEAEVLQFERESAEAGDALARIEEEIRAAEKLLEENLAQHVEAQKTIISASHYRDQARGELARLSSELAASQNELVRLRREANTAQQRAEQARAMQARATDSRGAAETELTQADERLVSLRQLIEAHQEELATRRTDLATIAERLASAETVRERLASDRREFGEREAALRQQQTALGTEREQLEAQTLEQQQQAESLRAEKTRLDARKAELEREWEQARVRTVEVDDALRGTRQKLGDLREQRGQVEIERARNDSDRQHLRESCLEELNAHPEDLIAEAPTLLAGEELAAAETNYREMKARVESMGPVNMMALEEYQECEQRCGFLTRERDDLLQSIADTQQAIAELDEVSRQKFEEAFAIINANFAEAFRTLFGGGTGEMHLTEADSSGDAGIDIAAQPPGKRLQNVLLLSGGEKALTALALLIAIFRYQPSPFCILDEVDAPLDEANVGRFGEMIRVMSEKTQFIVVTHNRRTMEMAPVLYGVTMQEPGVSKIVSVRWDEQKAEAASNAA
jgi:chromosome segregation protein